MKCRSWWATDLEPGITLDFRETSIPEPATGEIRLRVHAASLNRGELLQRPSHAKAGEARRLGVDAAGEVEAVGPGHGEWNIGDRVMLAGRGAFSEYMIADARQAMRIPPNLGWAEAAAVPVTMLTAYDILCNEGHLARDEWVLVTAVSSGVGVACLQMSKLLGARVIGTSGSPDKLGRLRALGLDVALATHGADIRSAVDAATDGHGIDLAVNNVGGTMFAACMDCLAFQGKLATVGYLDGSVRAPIDLGALHRKRLRLFGVSARMQSASERAQLVSGFIKDILPALADARIRPIVDKVFSFEDLPKAKAHLEAGAHLGKIVIAL